MFISKKKQVLISLIGDYRGENVTGEYRRADFICLGIFVLKLETQMTLPLFAFGCPRVSFDTCSHLNFTFLPINTSSVPHHYFPPSPSSVSLHPPLDFPVCDHSLGTDQAALLIVLSAPLTFSA